MKKLLLLMAFVLSLGFASYAETVTLTTEFLGMSGNSYTNYTKTDEASGLTFKVRAAVNQGIAMNKNKGAYLAVSANTKNVIIKSIGINFNTKGNAYVYKIVKSNTAFTIPTTTSSTATLEGTEVAEISNTNNSDGGTFEVNDTFVGIFQVSGNLCAFSSIVITYEEQNPKAPAGLAFAEDAYKVNLGEEFTAPELINPNNLNVTYASSKENVAKFAEDGTLEILAAGTTIITATSEETDEFNKGEASYTLTVIDPNALDVTFDFTISGAYGFTPKDGQNYETNIKSVKDDIVTIDFTGNYRQWQYTANNSVCYELRVHKNSSMTFSVPEAYYITSIEFTGSALTKLTTNTANCSYSNGIVTCTGTDVSKVVVKDPSGDAGDTQKINTITVKYALAESGIADIEVEENGVVEYYNIQGVRVAEPASGIYIRRCGNKAEKVVIR